MDEKLRTFEQRKADVLKRLETDRDVWVATASRDGRPHLLPAAEAAIGELFVKRTNWDPRKSKTAMVFLLMKPVRIQAWKSEPELVGRTIMKDGSWTD